MELDIVNPYVMKILVAARPTDTISAIAERIDVSYGWTHKWAKQLIEAGVFAVVGGKLVVQEDNPFYRATIEYVKKTFGANVSFHYSVLKYFGIHYCFAKTDAVYVWTKGGYNIGRSKEHYPIFIQVKKNDKNCFEHYCATLGLRTKRSGVFYDVEWVDSLAYTMHDGIPVNSLNETISFAKKYIYNFQPALEMISEMYKKKTGVTYKEVVTNV